MDGFYTVAFQTPLDAGAGVVWLRDGELTGGDTTMFYTGKYTSDGGSMTATIDIDTHFHMPGSTSIFGTSRDRLEISGRITDDGRIIGTASVAGSPGPGASFIMKRVPD